jgi:hypothetical protein
MKYTRYEFKYGPGARLKESMLLFLIIIPVIAIAAGLIISRYLLIPYLYKPESTEKQAGYIYQDIKSRKYYIVQAGVFSSETNLDLIAGKMRSSGLPVYIKQEEQLFRIITFAGPDYNSASREIERYKSSGYSCITKELSIVPGQVRENLKTEEAYKRLNRIIDFTGDEIDTTSKLLSGYDPKSSGLDSLHEKLKGTSSEFLKIMNDCRTAAGEKNQQLDDMIKQCEIIDNTLNEISALNDDINFYCKSQEIMIKAVYMYYDLIDIYNKNVTNY